MPSTPSHPKRLVLGAALSVCATLLAALLAALFAAASFAAPPAAAFKDDIAQRVLACTSCHGQQGRAAPDGYYPRLAGKPAGYLYNQLVNFRDGKRHYGLMTQLLAPLTDTYLMEMAQHFAAQQVPYPAPRPSTNSAEQLARGKQLVTSGEAERGIPACVQCHGSAMTGVCCTQRQTVC